MGEWREVEFHELLVDGNISYGIVQPGSHVEQDYVPVLRVNNIRDGRIKTDGVLQVASDIESKYSRTRLEGGELLITVVGNPGQCAIVPPKFAGFNVARAVSVARINDEADKRFIRYAFRSEDIIFQIYGGTNDTVQPTLNFSSLKTLRFSLPDLAEQRAIADVLTSLGDKIDLPHRQNKTLEAMAETLFRQWFVEEAEDDWLDQKLPDKFEFEMGTSPKSETFNEQGDGMPMFQGNADFGLRFPKRRVYTTDPKRTARPGDTLVSVRAPVGAQDMAIEEYCIGRGVAAFRLRGRPEFTAYAYYKLRAMMSDVKQFNAEGTVFGAISKRDVIELPILRPPFDLVTKF